MKTSLHILFAALAATVVLAGCVQEITPPSFEKDKVNPAAEGSRVIAVSFAPQTKTALDKDGFQPKFEDGKDTVLISNTNALDTCVVSVKDNKATISTNLTGPLTAVYPYKAAKMNESNLNQIDTVLVSAVQSGKFADANICMAKMKDGKDESLSFENKTAVFCIHPPAGKDAQHVKVSAEGFVIANNIPTGSAITDSSTIHVNTTTADSVYVSILVPEGLKVSHLTFSDGTNVKTVTGDKASTEIAAGTLYTVTNENWESPEADIPDGALKGVFSVSADKQVRFSQGNLYAKKDNNGMWNWGFYAKQYQYNSLSTSSSRTAADTDTEIDLFTWGYDNTSSNDSYSFNPVNTKGITAHTTTEDKQLVYNTDSGDDWGVAYCSSNNITVGTWRTLTTEEWQYLFSYDGTAYGEDNHDNDIRRGNYKYGVTVCGKANCVVLLPDSWKWEGAVGLGWQTEYPETQTSNEVTWQTMEDAGAVCLPAAGRRDGSDVDGVGGYGGYWSSSATDEYAAYGVGFEVALVTPDGSDYRNFGCSVRLVTNVSAAPTPTPTEPEYVEITMTVGGQEKTYKWAKCNLGAEKETDYGKYYAWGDTEGQAATTSGTGAFATAFDWTNCPFNNGSSNYDETYFNGIKNTVCPDGVLAKNHDVANKVLGGTWRLPTKEEFDALCNLTKEWKTNYNNSGVNGYLFTDENDHSIFLPAAGYGGGTGRSDASGLGRYWSSSLDTSNPLKAFYLYFSGGSADTGNRSRYNGHSVRPVSDLL